MNHIKSFIHSCLLGVFLTGNLLFFPSCSNKSVQQQISFTAARFKTGDNPSWKEKDYDDSNWDELQTNLPWERQGYEGYDGYAWYRIRFFLPSSLLESSSRKEWLHFNLAKIDDVDETYLNGKQIGNTGSFPDASEGYRSQWNTPRLYTISVNDEAIVWNGENVLAIRVYDGDGDGGMFDGTPFVYLPDLLDQLSLDFGTAARTIELTNEENVEQIGYLKIVQIEDQTKGYSKREIFSGNIKVPPKETLYQPIDYLHKIGTRTRIVATYTDKTTKKIKQTTTVLPYLLTPAPGEHPQINGPKVFGIRPGSPFLFKIPASGKSPIRYAVTDLPQGLNVDAETGIITGTIEKEGIYKMTFIASNATGKTEREFTVKAGDLLALSPPMGWNSWNCWGGSVTADKVRSSAQALIDKGLINYGWTYINIDDCWQAPQRDKEGNISGNEHFPDLKGLGDWLHHNGLKFGIYSSPGTKTCAGYEGSYRFEEKDARQYAEWGIDYLKYDWCSYGSVFTANGERSREAYMNPYLLMGKYLSDQKRDIIYSLCQYGMDNVWEWGAAVNGNCWRTTGDIVDTWASLRSIGFSQTYHHPYSGPGRWNDPDMLIVGMVGWGEHLHPTRLTPDEQYAHISLGALLAAPLLIGCDINQMDDFTLNLLTNSEVIDVNQDPLGKQAQQVHTDGDIQVWVKDLGDGSKAVGIFNLGDTDQTAYPIDFAKAGISKVSGIRDLWRQKNIPVTAKPKIFIPAHGVVLWKCTPVAGTNG